jgi:hypothetical protein
MIVLEEKKCMRHCKISSKLIRPVKGTMDNTVAKFQVQTEMMELFKIMDVLKQVDGLPPLLFSIVMEYVMRKVTVGRNATLWYKLMQIV